MAAVVVAAAVMLLAPAGAYADATWTGGGDGINWSDPANWSGDPIAGGQIRLPAGASVVDLDTSPWGIGGTWLDQAGTHTLTVQDGGTLKGGSEIVIGDTDALIQTGGVVNSKIRCKANQETTVVISGGQMTSAYWMMYNSRAADPHLWHVVGSGASSIDVGYLTFQNRTQENTTFQFDLDASGVTPITLTNGNGVRNYSGDNALLDLSDIVAYDPLANGLSVPLFNFVDDGSPELTLFQPGNITIGGNMPFGAASASVTQTGAGITLDFVAAALGNLLSENDGSWNTPATWLPQQQPTTNDIVTVNGETVTVTAAGNAGRLNVTSGQVDVNNTLTIANGVIASGGTLNVNNGATVDATFVKAAGGTVNINNGGTLDVESIDNGTVTIAAGGTVNVDNVASSNLAVNTAANLTVAERLTVDSLLDLSAGTLTVDGATVELATGGTLQRTGGYTVATLGLVGSGGGVNFGGNGLSITDSMSLTGSLDLAAEPLSVTNTLSVTAGTLTVGNAVTPDTLSLVDNASLAGAGSVIPTTKLELIRTSLADDLSGGYYTEIGGGVVELSGTNTYTGKTVVTGVATLKVTDLDKNVGAGNLELNNGYLASSGTVARNIGTGNGELSIAGNFGFTADGADLAVTLNGGAPLEWNTHFGGKTLLVNQLGSHTVEITNDINLQGGRTFHFGSTRGTADVGLKLSGDLSGGSIRFDEHRTGADYGVCWLAGSDLSGVSSYRLRTAGIVRFVDEATGLGNLPPNPAFGEVYYSQIETNGTFQFRGNTNLGNTTPGYICLNWGGGFSAYGGDLTVHLIGDTEADPFELSVHAFGSGFGEMYLNSPYSDGVVTIKGDFVNGTKGYLDNWPIRIFNNPDTDADYARLESNWSMEGVRIQANNSDGGIVELVEGFTITTDNTQGQAGEFTVQNSAEFRLNGILDARDGGNVVIRASGRLSGTGTVYVAGIVDVQGGTTIAPGNSGGTLTIDGDLQLDANSTYECEVEDLIAVAGDLDIPAGNVTVKLMDSEFLVGGAMSIFTYLSFDDDLANLVLDATALVGSGLLTQPEADALVLTDDLAGSIFLNGLSAAPVFPDLPGYANDSGFVDDDDLAILLSNWESDPGTITTWALGDFTADTDVDDDDLAVLLGNWTGPAPGGAAVPEPVSAVLLLIGAPLAALRRRRK